ncbi:rCG29752 [Rattus norvegicus]|uniref:RCG29752 n=1 Tax=Rattus norvegicus TaxID=10116 RepID=A6IKZ3_RAT|nr:rCG29752 [Rattus norvegicus]
MSPGTPGKEMEASGSSSQSPNSSAVHRETEDLNHPETEFHKQHGKARERYERDKSSSSSSSSIGNVPLPPHLLPPPQTAAMRTSTPEVRGNTEGSRTETALLVLTMGNWRC